MLANDMIHNIARLLKEIEKSDLTEFNEYEMSNIKLIRKDYDKKVKVPTELVEESSRLNAEGFGLWVQAKTESDFTKFAPILKKWIALRKKIVSYTHPNVENVYDAVSITILCG
jgi:carboxypeptidase Taq